MALLALLKGWLPAKTGQVVCLGKIKSRQVGTSCAVLCGWLKLFFKKVRVGKKN